MGILDNHFLNEDYVKADKELQCMTHCLSRAIQLIETEDYVSATAYIENVLRSMQELQRLNMKKQHCEKLTRLVADLGKENVKVMLLHRK